MRDLWSGSIRPASPLVALPSARAALRAIPELTLAVDPPEELDPAFDLAVSAADADGIEACFARAPIAAVSAALLLRTPRPDVDGGLVAESATYSVLQAGPEFRAWRAATAPAPAGDADGPRVRVESTAGVTEIVLTRAARHNALDVAMRDALDAALRGRGLA